MNGGTDPSTNNTSYDEFVRAMHDILNGTASDKRYSQTGPDGHNALYEFVRTHVAFCDGHALGEIVYKAVRYQAKRNPEDLVKIAAWAFLAWKHRDRG